MSDFKAFTKKEYEVLLQSFQFVLEGILDAEQNTLKYIEYGVVCKPYRF